MKRVLIDVGGTSLKGTSCAPGGLIQARTHVFPAQADLPREELIRHLADVIIELAGSEAEVELALAFPGPFDYEKGIPYMRGLAKYESLYGVSLPDAISPLLPFQAAWRFINDVAAFALGVQRTHHLKGRTMAVCLGTGAGSAFLIDGGLTVDAREGVPEHGWIYPIPYKSSIVDDYLSARGLMAWASGSVYEGKSPREIAEAARGGDEAALNIYASFGEDLREALAPIAGRFHADTIVLGGQISLSADLFDGALRNAVSAEVVVVPDTSMETLYGLDSLFSGDTQIR